MGSLGQSRRTQKQKRQDELVQLGQSGIPARLLTQEAALLALEQALVACLEPRLFPLIITNGCAQSEHRIDMRALPVHASSFESCLYDPLVGTFHTATANGPTRLLIAWILHVLLTLAEVGDLLVEIRDVWMQLKQTGHFLQDRCWSVVLEFMQLLSQPLGRQRGASCPHQLSNLTQIACRMGKVQNAHRIRPMQIHEALDPLGSILHRPYLFGLTDSPALGFHGRQSAKGRCVGQTGKIREGDGLDLLLWSRLSGGLFALDMSNDHGFDFCPDSSH